MPKRVTKPKTGRYRILYFAIAGMLAATAGIGHLAAKWNPVLSQDTMVFYYPPVKAINHGMGVRNLLDPFLLRNDGGPPSADAAKPVFVSALVFWHGIVNLIAGVELPNHRLYSAFLNSTLLLSLLACLAFGFGIGLPYLGLLAGFAALVNEWNLVSVYFNAYQGLTLFMLMLALVFMHSNYKFPAVAGALMSLNVLANQSTCIFAVSLAVPLLIERKKAAWLELIRYSAGALICWAAIEALVFLFGFIDGADYQSRLRILLGYLGRSNSERLQPVYEQFIAPVFLWNFSVSLTVGFLAALGFFCWRLYEGKTQSWERALFWCILATVCLIEFRSGPKFARTYALLLPFVYFFVAGQGLAAWNLKTRLSTVIKAAVAALACCYLLIDGRDTVRMAHAFLDVPIRIANSNSMYFFDKDTYKETFQLMTEQNDGEGKLKWITAVCDIPETEAELILSPVYKSALNRPNVEPMPIMPESLELSGDCPGRQWHARRTEQIPFFSHHPFLALEDPEVTNVMVGEKLHGWDEFDSGIGRVSVYKIQFSGSQ